MIYTMQKTESIQKIPVMILIILLSKILYVYDTYTLLQNDAESCWIPSNGGAAVWNCKCAPGCPDFCMDTFDFRTTSQFGGEDF